MDRMLGENKNLKDPERKSLKTLYGAGTLDMSLSLPYTKTNKLITALYMVTDTMEKEEPMRLKLRTLGVEILSDIFTTSRTILDVEKINQILSFLNIASDIRMISEMNCNILRKEFVELKQSIEEFTTQDHLWLEKFINKEEEGRSFALAKDRPSSLSSRFIGMSDTKTNMSFSKGHSTRIGVQKGSTLLKALSKVGNGSSFLNSSEDREILKNKRRELISKILKDKSNGVSIKDIMLAIQNLGEVWGEKTLQRELVSMVKDNVLKKTGEKRWSLYALVSSS